MNQSKDHLWDLGMLVPIEPPSLTIEYYYIPNKIIIVNKEFNMIRRLRNRIKTTK